MKVQSVNRRIAWNTSTNFVKYGSQVVIAFIMTPFIIRSVGDSFYGVWLVVLSFAGYAAILEFGVHESIIKLVSKYETVRDEQKINHLFSIGFALMFGLSLAAFTVLFWVVPGLLPGLIQDAAGLAVAQLLLKIVAIDALFILNNFIFSGIIYGFQLYHIKNGIDFVVGVFSPVLIYVLIRLEYGVISLAIANLSVNVLNLLIFAGLCKLYFRPLKFTFDAGCRSAMREIFQFSSRIFTSATALRAARYAQPLIIAAWLPTVWNTFYSVPSRLADYGAELLYVLSRGFMPIFSEYHSRGDQAAIRELYFRYTRFIVAGFFPLILCLLVFGDRFLSIWMSPEYAEKGRWVLHLLVLSVLVQSSQPLWAKLLIGVERLNVIVRVNVFASLLQVVLGLVLVRRYGISGMAASVLVSMVISQVIYFRHVAAYLRVSAGEYLAGCHARALLASGAFLAIILGLRSLHLPETYSDLLWQVGAGGTAYLPLGYLLVLRADERRILKGHLGTLAGWRPASREVE